MIVRILVLFGLILLNGCGSEKPGDFHKDEPMVTLPSAGSWESDALRAPIIVLGRVLSVQHGQRSLGQMVIRERDGVRLGRFDVVVGVETSLKGKEWIKGVNHLSFRSNGKASDGGNAEIIGSRVVVFLRPTESGLISIFEGEDRSLVVPSEHAIPFDTPPGEAIARLYLIQQEVREVAVNRALRFARLSEVTSILRELTLSGDKLTAKTACIQVAALAPYLAECVDRQGLFTSKDPEAVSIRTRRRLATRYANGFLSDLPHARLPDCYGPDSLDCLIGKLESMAQSTDSELHSKACRLLKTRLYTSSRYCPVEPLQK